MAFIEKSGPSSFRKNMSQKTWVIANHGEDEKDHPRTEHEQNVPLQFWLRHELPLHFEIAAKQTKLPLIGRGCGRNPKLRSNPAQDFKPKSQIIRR